MRHRVTTLSLVLGMALTSSSCDPATAVAVPILVITNTWQVEGEEGRTFAFSTDEDESEQGTFDGSEDVQETFESHYLTGFWTNGQIQFTVERPGGDVVYNGTFNQHRPTRLTMQSSDETIVLVQS